LSQLGDTRQAGVRCRSRISPQRKALPAFSLTAATMPWRMIAQRVGSMNEASADTRPVAGLATMVLATYRPGAAS
jgi:hypothetical protein